jgi:hypothetical protein
VAGRRTRIDAPGVWLGTQPSRLDEHHTFTALACLWAAMHCIFRARRGAVGGVAIVEVGRERSSGPHRGTKQRGGDKREWGGGRGRGTRGLSMVPSPSSSQGTLRDAEQGRGVGCVEEEGGGGRAADGTSPRVLRGDTAHSPLGCGGVLLLPDQDEVLHILQPLLVVVPVHAGHRRLIRGRQLEVVPGTSCWPHHMPHGTDPNT